MTEANILELYNKYRFLNTYHINVPGPEDQVTSGPINRLAIYKIFFMLVFIFLSTLLS